MTLKKTDPLIAECDQFIHAATCLAGMIALRLAMLNPKGIKEYMLPVADAIQVDRLRTVNLEVVGVRALARCLRDDIAAGAAYQLGRLGETGSSATGISGGETQGGAAEKSGD